MFELIGQAQQNAAVSAAAEMWEDLLGNRIRPVTVHLKTDNEMPKRSDGGPAFGFWRSVPRQVWLWDETDEYPLAKTFAHEAMHVLDRDWLTRAQRRSLMELMLPLPNGWNDQLINGEKRRYVALPSEIFAVYASAAIGGFSRPAYRALFVRHVPEASWEELANLVLDDDGPAEEEDEPNEEVVSPPDPFEGMAERLAEAEARATRLEAKLRKARQLAAEINAI